MKCSHLHSRNFTPQTNKARNQSQIFNRKSIWRDTTHRQSHHLQAMLTGVKRRKANTSFLSFGSDLLFPLVQRKEDDLSRLNRLKKKAIRSRVPLYMANDMIAIASNWEERLRAPKCEKKDDPQVWGTSFPDLITLTKREKNLNMKAMITYKRPTTIGQLHTNCKHPWASERYSPGGGPVGDFPICFSKCGKIWFLLLEIEKNKPFFATNFEIQWEPLDALLAPPSDAHASTLLQARRESMSKGCRVLVATVHFVVTMDSTTNQWCHVFHK